MLRSEGRLPTRDEETAALSKMITNRSIQIGDRFAANIHQSRFADHSEESVRQKVDSLIDGDAPLPILMTREAMKLAKRLFRGVELRIFTMAVFDCDSNVRIARAVGMSVDKVTRKLRALLWRARSDSKLASALRCEAESPPSLRFAERHSPQRIPARVVA